MQDSRWLAPYVSCSARCKLIWTVSKPSISQTARILLLEGGSLDRVRGWTGEAEFENRISSLTAENVNWLRCTSHQSTRGDR